MTQSMPALSLPRLAIFVAIAACLWGGYGLLAVAQTEPMQSENRFGWSQYVLHSVISGATSSFLIATGILTLLRTRFAVWSAGLVFVSATLGALWMLDASAYLGVISQRMTPVFLVWWFGGVFLAGWFVLYLQRLRSGGTLT